MHNPVAEFSPNTPRSLYLTNIGDVPVHLTKGYVIGTATACNGPLHVVEEEEESGALLTMGADPRDMPDEEFKTGRQAEDRIDEGQPPPHQASPRVSVSATSTVCGSDPATDYWLTVRRILDVRV